MSETHLDFMNEAFQLAQHAFKIKEVPIGAVLVLNNRVIGKGYNRVIKTSDPTAHAEIIALRQAGKIIRNYRMLDTDMYVTLEPCLMCYAALVNARIKNLYFGAFDLKGGIFSTGKFEAVKSIFNHTINVKSGIMEDQSANLLKDFFKKRRGARVVEWDGLENR